MAAQRNGIVQGHRADGQHDLVRAHTALQQGLQQGRALGHAEGRPLAGGAKQGDAVAAGVQHRAGVLPCGGSVRCATRVKRLQKGRP